MHLIWTYKNFKDDVDFILFHQKDTTPEWWRKQLFKEYPDLDYEYTKSLPEIERFEYIIKQMQIISKKRHEIIDNSIFEFQKIWNNQINNKLNIVYSSAFDNDCSNILNNMIAKVSLNPICPRNIEQSCFDIYYNLDKQHVVCVALHEITHFVWFYFWEKHFKDNSIEYEFPQLKWLLSEIVVETIIRNSDIKTLSKQPKYIAYSYFYDMTINGEYLFNTLKQFYLKRENIYDFMEKSFIWIKQNEQELRKKITDAEK